MNTTTGKQAEPSSIEKTHKRACYDYLFISVIAQIYAFAFFLRSAIAPISDVLEDDFNATSSEIGLCSSLLFIGYFSMQIPSGMALQVYSPEFISLCCSLLMGVCAILFALSPNIEFASVTQLFSGIAQSATAISILSVSDKRFGSEAVPFVFGIVKLYCYLSLIAMQYLQALIYETYSVWRPVFYFCGGCCLILAAISLFALIIESIIDRNRGLDECESTVSSPLNLRCYPLRNWSKRDEYQPVWVSLKRALQNPMNYVYSLYAFSMVFVLYGFYGLWLISYLLLKYGYSISGRPPL